MRKNVCSYSLQPTKSLKNTAFQSYTISIRNYKFAIHHIDNFQHESLLSKSKLIDSHFPLISSFHYLIPYVTRPNIWPVSKTPSYLQISIHLKTEIQTKRSRVVVESNSSVCSNHGVASKAKRYGGK